MTWEIEICNQCKWEIPKGAKKCMHCGTNIALEKQKKGCTVGCLVVLVFIILIAIISSLSRSISDYGDTGNYAELNDSPSPAIDNPLWSVDITSWAVETQTKSILDDVDAAVKAGNELGKVSGIEAMIAKFGNFEVTARNGDDFATDNTNGKIEIIVNADANNCNNAKDIVFAIMKSIFTSKHARSVSRVKVNIPYYLKVSLGSQHSWLKWTDLSAEGFIDAVQGHGKEEVEEGRLDQRTFWRYLSSCY